MFIKDLTPGQSFTTPDSRGTVYKVRGVRAGQSMTVVTYTVGSDPLAWEFIAPSLSTCSLV